MRFNPLFLFTIILVGAGCSQTPAVQMPPAPTDVQATKPAIERVTVQPSSSEPGDQTLRIILRGADGQELSADDLKVVHEKKYHLLLVRDDLTEFQHLHPEFVDGSWRVTTTIPKSGTYHLYSDIAPLNEPTNVTRTSLRIGSNTMDPQSPTPQLVTMTDDIQVTLSSDVSPMSGMTHAWTFLVEKNGTPVAKIDPYLGAFGHAVLLEHGNPDEFVHVHPVTDSAPTDGRVIFEAAVPRPGRYTFFAQFKIDGVVRTFPLTVDVADSATLPAMDHSMH
ncbi:hypothetical protein KBC59_01760 [Patescibacteria group bacterium]|nr:hypothetical protein [Patescibacteria group bacterium]